MEVTGGSRAQRALRGVYQCRVIRCSFLFLADPFVNPQRYETIIWYASSLCESLKQNEVLLIKLH